MSFEVPLDGAAPATITNDLVNACTLAYDDSLSAEINLNIPTPNFSYEDLPRSALLSLMTERDRELAECTVTIRELRASFAREFREKLSQHQQQRGIMTQQREREGAFDPPSLSFESPSAPLPPSSSQHKVLPARLRHVSFTLPAPAPVTPSNSSSSSSSLQPPDWFDIFV